MRPLAPISMYPTQPEVVTKQQPSPAAKVGQCDAAAGTHQRIFRLQVAVHHTLLAVQVVECLWAGG